MRAVNSLLPAQAQQIFNFTLVGFTILTASAVALSEVLFTPNNAARLSLALPVITAALAFASYRLIVRRRIPGGPRLSRAAVTVGAAISAALAMAWILNDGLANSVFGFEPFSLGESTWAKFASALAITGFGLAILVGIKASSSPRAILVSVFVALACCLFFFLRVAKYVAQEDATVFVDELLAPSAGKWPLFDYVSQYSTLLGWPLTLFDVNERDEVLELVINYIGVLQIATLVTLVGVASLATAARYLWLPCLLIPSVAVMQIYGSQSGSDIWTNLPNRIFLPSLALLLLVVSARQRSNASLAVWLFASNFIAGVAFLNNVDFGAVCAGSTFVTSLVIMLKRKSLNLVFVLAAMVFPFAIYWALGFIAQRPPNYSFITLYLRGFVEDSSFLQISSMPAIGWPLVALATFGSGLTIALVTLAGKKVAAPSSLATQIAIFYLSLVGLGGFFYYASRPVPIVATSLLPWWATLVCVLSISLLSQAPLQHVRGGLRETSRNLVLALPLVVLSGATALTLLSQSPLLPSNRLASGMALQADEWGIDRTESAISNVDVEVAQPDGNLNFLINGKYNPLVFNSPLALVVDTLRDEQCARWKLDRPTSVLLWVGPSIVNPPLETVSCPGATNTRLSQSWVLIEYN